MCKLYSCELHELKAVKFIFWSNMSSKLTTLILTMKIYFSKRIISNVITDSIIVSYLRHMMFFRKETFITPRSLT